MDGARSNQPVGGTIELGRVEPAEPATQSAPSAPRGVVQPAAAAAPVGIEPVTALPVGIEPVTAPPFMFEPGAPERGPSWWDDPTPVTPAAPPYPLVEPAPSLARNFRLLAVAMTLLVVVIVAAVLAAALSFTALRDAGVAAPARSAEGAGTASPGAGTGGTPGGLTAPVGDLRDAEFELVTGATSVTVRGGDLGGDLYRISTPVDASALPNVVRQGSRVMLHLVPTGQPGPAAVEVRLSARVRWQVRLSGGAAEHRVDLSGGRLAGLDVVGGAARIDLTLPRPDGAVAVRMSGGASEMLVRAPAGVPARVRIGGGASSVTVDGVSRAGLAAGTVLTPRGWEQSADRYDIDAVVGVARLRLDRG